MLTWALCYLYSVILANAAGKVLLPMGFLIMAMMIDGLIIAMICCSVCYILIRRRLDNE